MRLIDADELVKYLKKYHSMSQGIISDVEHFPTSYDLDKIVNQIKKLSVKCLDECTRNGFRGTLRTSGYIKAIEDAIEIIKKGDEQK